MWVYNHLAVYDGIRRSRSSKLVEAVVEVAEAYCLGKSKLVVAAVNSAASTIVHPGLQALLRSSSRKTK